MEHHQLVMPHVDKIRVGREEKARQITSGISSQSLDNMFHLDFSSVTDKQKEKTPKTHHKQGLLLHVAMLLT